MLSPLLKVAKTVEFIPKLKKQSGREQPTTQNHKWGIKKRLDWKSINKRKKLLNMLVWKLDMLITISVSEFMPPLISQRRQADTRKGCDMYFAAISHCHPQPLYQRKALRRTRQKGISKATKKPIRKSNVSTQSADLAPRVQVSLWWVYWRMLGIFWYGSRYIKVVSWRFICDTIISHSRNRLSVYFSIISRVKLTTSSLQYRNKCFVFSVVVLCEWTERPRDCCRTEVYRWKMTLTALLSWYLIKHWGKNK